MNAQKSVKKKVISSLFWKLLERGGTQGISFIVQLVLARLLLPADYGQIALVQIFILIATVLVQNGFSSALIQKKDADEADFSSIFYLNLFMASVLYTILFFVAPVISRFYEMPTLLLVLRVLSLTLFFGAFNSIQIAYLSRNMMFKKLFFSSLGAIMVSGTVGVTAAYLGWGVWALVAHQLTNQLMVTVVLWFTVKWRPKWLFSFEKVKVLFSYGWKLLLSSLISTLYTDLRSLFIGKIYSAEMLGFYNRGQQFPKLIITNIDTSIQSVMFPALSSHQDDSKRVKEMMRRAVLTSSFIIFPMMVGLAVVAKPLILILLTEKWLPAVPFMQIFCASFALTPIQTANLQAIIALGRSDIYLKLEIIKKSVGIGIILISLPFGIYALAWGVVLTSVLANIFNAYPNKKLLEYSYFEQWKDILPSLLISLVMGSVIYVFGLLGLAAWQILIIQVLLGAIIYIGLAKVFKVEAFNYLAATIKELFKGRKGE